MVAYSPGKGPGLEKIEAMEWRIWWSNHFWSKSGKWFLVLSVSVCYICDETKIAVMNSWQSKFVISVSAYCQCRVAVISVSGNRLNDLQASRHIQYFTRHNLWGSTQTLLILILIIIEKERHHSHKWFWKTIATDGRLVEVFWRPCCSSTNWYEAWGPSRRRTDSQIL